MVPTNPNEMYLVTNSQNDLQRTAEQLLDIGDRYRLHENRDLVRALQDLRRRTAARELTLAVLSESTESKSRLIEILLNARLADAAIPPSAVACTYLAYGAETESAVTLTNSLTARLPLDQLTEFVSEKVPASSLQKVLVRFPNAALKDGLVVIDTPPLAGTPEVLLACTATALAESDVCIFVIAARPRLSENAIAFLRGVQGSLDKFFFVLDGVSRLSVPRQNHAVERLTTTLQQQCGLSKPRVSLLLSTLPEADDANQGSDEVMQWMERSKQFRAKLLEFAAISSRASTSNEVAQLAGETLTHADRLLRSSGSPLRRARLRRGVRALEEMVTQSKDLALAEYAVMRSFGASQSEDHDDGSVQSFKAAPEVPSASEGAKVIGAEEVSSVRTSLFHAEAALPFAAAQESSTSTASQEAIAELAPHADSMPGQPVKEVIQSTNAPAAMATFTLESFTAWVGPGTTQASGPSQVARGEGRTTERNQARPASEETPVTATGIVSDTDQPAASLSTPADAKQASTPSPLQELGVATQAELPPALDSSELPESVKAWYAMPIGPPAKRARRILLRRAGRPAVIREVAAGEEQSSAPPEELQENSASTHSSNAGDQELAHKHYRSPVWRVVGLGAVAALALVLTTRSHLAAPPATRAQLHKQYTHGDSSLAERVTDAQPRPTPPEVKKPTATLPHEGISTPPQDSLTAKRSAATVKADGAPSGRPAHTFYNSRGQLLGVRPYVANSVSYPASPARPSPADTGTLKQAVSVRPAEQHPSASYYVKDASPDLSLQSALNRWVDTFRAGNIKAQVACYAPFVDTYFNWRNVTPEQLQYDKQRAWRKTANVHKYDVTPVSVTNQGDGRKAVLLQKDWDTTTTRGTVFSGSEIEKLVFARIQGEWKIVGEQEVKVLKLRRD